MNGYGVSMGRISALRFVGYGIKMGRDSHPPFGRVLCKLMSEFERIFKKPGVISPDHC
jgi:hypothetical protein